MGQVNQGLQPAFNVNDFGARGNGTTNDTTAIQSAIDACGSVGGGIVQLGNGTYLHSGLTLKNRVWLRGQGMRATQLFLAASANTNCIVNYVSGDGTAANALFCKVSDLMIHGNKANQSAGTQDTNNGNTFGRDGIFFSTYPLYTQANLDDYFDSHQSVERVLIYQCKGNGFTSHGRSDITLKEVVASENEYYGFVPSYDINMDHCVAGGNYRSGFYIKDRSSVRMNNCKAFYSGHNAGTAITSTSSYGFEIVNCYDVALTGCEAQDNYNSGFSLVNNVGANVLSACVADSNSKRGVGSRPAIDIWNSNNNKIDVICTERKADGANSFQTLGLRIRSNSSGNDINIKHYGVGNGTVNTAQAITSDSDAWNNNFSVNNEQGYNPLAYAGTVTPDPYAGSDIVMTLTGNLVVNAPVNGHRGSKLNFVFIEDGPGGRTVTWNAVYKTNWSPNTASGKVNTINFIYDGTSWIQIGSSTNL